MKKNHLLWLAAILTASGITIFHLTSQYYLAFPPPYPSGALNFIGSLGFIVLDIASACIFLWFIDLIQTRLGHDPRWPMLWALLVAVAVYFLYIGQSAILPLLSFMNENIYGTVGYTFNVIEVASYGFVALFVFRHIRRPVLSLMLAWISILIWKNFILLFITYFLSKLFGSDLAISFWQFQHPDWLISYWPEFLGTAFIVAAAWYGHKSGQLRSQA